MPTLRDRFCRSRLCAMRLGWPFCERHGPCGLAVVLAKSDIQDPVVGVLDAPVLAHRLQQGLGLGGQAGDGATDVGRDPVPAAAFALHSDLTGQVASLPSGIHIGEIGGVRCARGPSRPNPCSRWDSRRNPRPVPARTCLPYGRGGLGGWPARAAHSRLPTPGFGAQSPSGNPWHPGSQCSPPGTACAAASGWP